MTTPHFLPTPSQLISVEERSVSNPTPTRVSNVVKDLQTGRTYSMPGGGLEIKFPYAIEPKYIKGVNSI